MKRPQQRKYMLSGLRPQIQRILQVEECLKCFKEFCKEKFTSESLDCILYINRYLEETAGDSEDGSIKYIKLKEIYETYILDSSEKTVNVGAVMKNEISQFCKETPESVDFQKVDKALEGIRDELINTLSFQIPHFVDSRHWHDFAANHQLLVTQCLDETDSQKLEKIRYRREDFIRDRCSEKEVMLCEFMKDDHSMFKLQKSDLNGCLSVYTCDGKDILDENDIGMGKFQGFKVAGSLPYPPWLIMMALASTKFHADIWQGYRFDREYDFRYIPASEEENGQLFYDTHIAKLVVSYGKILEHRSSYCMTENLYKGNRTYMINKSITPHDGKYVANYFKDINKDIVGEYETHNTNLIDVNPIINMKGRKKCVHMPVIALFAIQPFGDNQSLFSYSNLTNPGGMLLSKLGTPQKRLLEIATTYRENIIGGIQKLLENDGQLVKRMKNVYETVQTRLNRFKIASKSTESHIFEPSFEEQLAKLFSN